MPQGPFSTLDWFSIRLALARPPRLHSLKDALRRRPDVRRAERLAAAQSERIGIAEADFYPAIGLRGKFGWQANNFPALFSSHAFDGLVAPGFQWNLLEYGRILNNVRFQDANFQALVAAYQQTVLRANGEAEDAIVTYLPAPTDVPPVEGLEPVVSWCAAHPRRGPCAPTSPHPGATSAANSPDPL